MIEPILRSELEPVARRRRLWRLSRDLAICWAVAALVGFAFMAVYRLTGWLAWWALPALGVGTLLGAIIVWVRSRREIPDYRELARQVERSKPQLQALLLTAVEQEPDAAGKYNFLQQRLIREAVAESVQGDWLKAVSNRQLMGTQLVQVAAFVVLLLALTGLRVERARQAAIGAPTLIKVVTPGDAAVEKGSSLTILARFDGPMPSDVKLMIRPDGQPERSVSLVKSLNDPLFGGSIPEVTNALSYRVAFPGGQSRDYKVEVFEYPRLERADAHLTFPEYTGLPERKIEDTRRITAVEGSTLDLALQLNKPVKTAQLVAKDKSMLPLEAPLDRANARLSQFGLKSSQAYELILVDADGRTNKVPTQIYVEVLTNRAPELKFQAPRGDQRVSPLEEITFQGEVWDDFGVKDYGLTYTLAGGQSTTISLGSIASAKEKRQFAHLLGLEDLAAEPDQLITYFIWADDTGPDGRVRRSASDMYYAEVRPFEEIFREGQSPAGGESDEQQGGQGNEAMRLSELQKQIINATWKLQRDHRVGLDGAAQAEDSTPKRAVTDAYTKDVAVVEQSQEEALRQAVEKKEESENPASKALWEAVETQMRDAARALGKAGKNPEPLPTALAAEQAAYQALLKLASREKQVSRGRGRGSGSGQSQSQLDQLDLTQSENRYENQRQAAANRQNP